MVGVRHVDALSQQEERKKHLPGEDGTATSLQGRASGSRKHCEEREIASERESTFN